MNDFRRRSSEEALLETAVRGRIEELREERRRLDLEEAERAADKELGYMSGVLSHLPNFPPLTVKKKKRPKNPQLVRP